ncbi:MAG: hypothetical protein DBY17_06160 [Oscillospiraceae bacterium]|nr:MAG: hypothetical protein DBY17_06160 [Oscillospiraceae bacterium]
MPVSTEQRPGAQPGRVFFIKSRRAGWRGRRAARPLSQTRGKAGCSSRFLKTDRLSPGRKTARFRAAWKIHSGTA